MRCPNDGKTRMTEGDDYLNVCPHCGVERYAARRCVNDMVRDWDSGVFDWSLPFEELEKQVSPAFVGLVRAAYAKVRALHPELTTPNQLAR